MPPGKLASVPPISTNHSQRSFQILLCEIKTAFDPLRPRLEQLFGPETPGRDLLDLYHIAPGNYSWLSLEEQAAAISRLVSRTRVRLTHQERLQPRQRACAPAWVATKVAPTGGNYDHVSIIFEGATPETTVPLMATQDPSIIRTARCLISLRLNPPTDSPHLRQDTGCPAATEELHDAHE
jgi:hypothetical protein